MINSLITRSFQGNNLKISMCLKIRFFQNGQLYAILDSRQKLDRDPISNLLRFRLPKGFVGISLVYRSYIVRYVPKKLRTNYEQISND